MATATPVDIGQGRSGAPPPDYDEYMETDATGDDREERAEPPKRPRGRPPKEDAEQGSFVEALSNLTDDDWETSLVYVWQADPILDLTKGGRENKYRMRFAQAIDEEVLLRELGSGTYKCQLNRMKSKSNGKMTCVRGPVFIKVFDPDRPPKLPPGDWIDDPRNAFWKPFRKAIEAQWAKSHPSEGGHAHAPDNAVPPWAVDLIRRVDHLNRNSDDHSKGINVVELVKLATAAQDPAKALESVTKMREMFAAPTTDPLLVKLLDRLLVPPPAKSDQPDPILMKMLDNAREDAKIAREEAAATRKQLADTQTKMFELISTKSAPPDVLGQIKGLGEAFGAIAEVTSAVGGGNAAPREWWQALIENVGPQLASGLNNLSNAAALWMNRKPQQPAQPARTTTVQHQPAAVTAAQPQPTQPQPAQPAATTTADVPAEMDSQTMGMVLSLANEVRMALEMLMPGDVFAETLIRKWGEPTYDQIITTPKEFLLTLVKGVPEAWAMLQAHEAKLPEFIDQFYAFNEAVDDEPPAPDDPPINTKKKPAKKKK